MMAAASPAINKSFYAPNGGELVVKNLNVNSTHPNPWRPPTKFEMGCLADNWSMGLNTMTQPTLIPQTPEFERKSLIHNLAIWGSKGFLIGN